MSAALSYSSGESATPLLGDTIGGNFDATVLAFADREALVDRSDPKAARRWTYAELAADVDALALGLLEMGIEKGDRVGIWAPNCAEWTLTQYATAKIGAILVNINPPTAPASLSSCSISPVPSCSSRRSGLRPRTMWA